MIEIKLYNSVFITHNPNIVGPTKKVFSLVFECCFHHSKLKILNLGDGNWEQNMCFQKLTTEFQWQFGK